MSQAPKFESFEEFWPYYVREHSNPTNRRLHFTGTALALASVGYALIKRRPKVLLVTPLLGYGFAWVGHFLVEKNRPATFTYPVWSLLGDFKMFGKMLTGTMEDEVRKAMADEPMADGPTASDGQAKGPQTDAAGRASTAGKAGTGDGLRTSATDGAASPRPSSSGRLN